MIVDFMHIQVGIFLFVFCFGQFGHDSDVSLEMSDKPVILLYVIYCHLNADELSLIYQFV